MSFEINWDRLYENGLNKQLSEQIRAFLDNQFQEMSLPPYIKSISVTSFDIGTEAPELEIKNITDPFPEFYSDGEDDGKEEEDAGRPDLYNIHRSSEGGNGAVPTATAIGSSGNTEGTSYNFTQSVGGNEPGIPHIFNDVLNHHNSFSHLHSPIGIRTPLYGGPWPGTAWPGASRPIFSPGPPKVLASASVNNTFRGEQPDSDEASDKNVNDKSSRNKDNDIQFFLEIKYRGNMKLSVTATLLLNYPSPSFVSLPLNLNISDLEICSMAVLAYIDKRVYFSFICDVGSNGDAITLSGHDRVEIIKSVRIESEIGYQQGNGTVLRNVDKVEKFLLEKIRSLVRDELAWPGWITLEL